MTSFSDVFLSMLFTDGVMLPTKTYTAREGILMIALSQASTFSVYTQTNDTMAYNWNMYTNS